MVGCSTGIHRISESDDTIMKLIITIDMSNEAFTDDPNTECLRIIEEAMARHAVTDRSAHPLYDYNGNKVGTMKVQRDYNRKK